MSIENIALDNITDVVENDAVTATTVVDPVTAVAYADSIASAERVEEVMGELSQKAPDAESPVTPEVEQKNIYTKLTLDESINDFNMSLKDLSDESDEDEYLDYDMFDFVYGLVTDDWPRPKNPLGRRMRKFQHTHSDDYIKAKDMRGESQVATDPNGNVVIYANEEAAFNDVREACDYYHISYSDVRARKSRTSHWSFNMTIYVPMTSEGYPVMVEDFFAKYGWKVSDVIEDHKVGGGKTANWGSTYEKRAEKDRAETAKYLNDKLVDEVFEEFVIKAARSSDPLEDFIKDMFNELDKKGLSYSTTGLKKKFNARFQDDFEDEE